MVGIPLIIPITKKYAKSRDKIINHPIIMYSNLCYTFYRGNMFGYAFYSSYFVYKAFAKCGVWLTGGCGAVAR